MSDELRERAIAWLREGLGREPTETEIESVLRIAVGEMPWSVGESLER